MVTKAQQMMIDDGLPPAAIISEEERKATWADSAAWAITHSKPHKDRNMNIENPDFAAMDMEALKEVYSVLTAEARDLGLPVKSLPADLTLPKLIKFCEDLNQLIRESKAEKKPLKYDNTDVSQLETAEETTERKAAENVAVVEAEKPVAEKPTKKPAKKKAKKEEPKEEPKKATPKKAAKSPAKKAAVTKVMPTKKTDQLPISAALGLRSGSKHEQIAVYLEARIGKMVKEKDIIKHVYGDPEVKTNRITDLIKVMKKDKYDIRKEDKNGTVSYGLYAKKG